MPIEVGAEQPIKKFNFAIFEYAFYMMLHRDFTMDLANLDRKFFYNGLTIRVVMVDSMIVKIIDLSNKDKILYCA